MKKLSASSKATPNNRLQLAVLAAGLAVVAGFFVYRSFAATGSLSVVRLDSNPLLVGSVFSVRVLEGSGVDAVNAVQADLSYPADKLQLVTPVDASASAFNVTAYENYATPGSILHARGFQSTDGATGLVGINNVVDLTFRTIAPGSATIAFKSRAGIVGVTSGSNVLVSTTPLTVNIGDTVAPSVPAGLTGSFTKASGQTSAVTLGWTPSTDNVKVTGYRVYRNGVLMATVPTPGFSETLRNGSYVYAVSAVDAAGNASARSASFSISPTRQR